MNASRNTKIGALAVTAVALVAAGGAFAAGKLHGSKAAGRGGLSVGSYVHRRGPGTRPPARHGLRRRRGRATTSPRQRPISASARASSRRRSSPGKTLAQIADATSGKSSAGLIDALVAAEQTELAAAVTAGTLTQAQADQIRDLKDRFTSSSTARCRCTARPRLAARAAGRAGAAATISAQPERPADSAAIGQDARAGRDATRQVGRRSTRSSRPSRPSCGGVTPASSPRRSRPDHATLKDRFTNLVNGAARRTAASAAAPEARPPPRCPPARAPTSSRPAHRLAGAVRPPRALPAGGTASQGLEHSAVETEARSGTYSQSLERGLAILSSFRSGSPLLGVSDLAREVGLSRSTTHRYISTLAALGYLQQDPAHAEVPARAARARPRLLGDQLDGPARGRRAPPAGAERRDRTHRQHGGARRRRHRLHRAVPHLAERPARHRPEPAHRLAPARVLHVDGQGAARRTRPRPAAGGARAGAVHAARAQRADRSRRAARRARARARRPAWRSTTRSSRTACGRSPRPCARRTARSSRRSTSPCTGRWSRSTPSSRTSGRS